MMGILKSEMEPLLDTVQSSIYHNWVRALSSSTRNRHVAHLSSADALHLELEAMGRQGCGRDCHHLASIAVYSQGSPGVHPISGREYARPMGVAGAPWLDRPEREAEEAPTRALQIISIVRGSTVADIGAGSGYFTERLARLVGPAGKVYATDIQQGMLDLLAQRLLRGRIDNVTLVRGEPADPKLPPASLDLALMVDVYHELADPQTVLRRIREALKPDGRLVLIEYKGEDATIPILPSHKMTVAQAKVEVEHEGFKLVRADSSLPRQHVLIFSQR
jgi:2-polyprenyl-3-methyl-5-hydroxy-6-metoxy-1,4-benzoquinol methylase